MIIIQKDEVHVHVHIVYTCTYMYIIIHVQKKLAYIHVYTTCTCSSNEVMALHSLTHTHTRTHARTHIHTLTWTHQCTLFVDHSSRKFHWQLNLFAMLIILIFIIPLYASYQALSSVRLGEFLITNNYTYVCRCGCVAYGSLAMAAC